MKKDIANHLGKQLAKNSYYCCSCKKTITGNRFKFMYHLYRHGKVNGRFTCEFCFKEFYRNDCYIRHLKVHKMQMYKETNMEQAQKLHVCDFCGRSFKNKRNLIQHFRIHDNMFKHPRNGAQTLHVCDVCGRSYKDKRNLIQHFRIHDNMFNPPRKQAQKLHFCDFCGKSYIEKRNLIQHFRIHDSTFKPPRTRYSCKVCGIAFCENRVLLGHIRKTHFNLQIKESPHKKKLPNETWVEKVIQSDAYVEMTKLTDNVIAIKKCILTDTEKKKVKDNKIVKTIEFKSFYTGNSYHKAKDVCSYCKKTMLKKSLANHIRERHLKVRRYKCDTCNSKFNRRYQLANHVCGKSRRKR